MTGRMEIMTAVPPTSDEILRLQALHYLPGEAVRRRSHDGAEEAGRIYVIESTIVTDGPGDGAGTFSVSYVFEGVPGGHPANDYEDEWGWAHHYGVVLMQDARMWLVALPEDQAADRRSDPYVGEIIGIRGRFVTGGVEDAGDTMDFLKAEMGMGGEGEFVVHPTKMGGDHRTILLGGIPWWSQATIGDIAHAHAAVARRRQDP